MQIESHQPPSCTVVVSIATCSNTHVYKGRVTMAIIRD